MYRSGTLGRLSSYSTALSLSSCLLASRSITSNLSLGPRGGLPMEPWPRPSILLSFSSLGATC